jgi:hypothetical protein
MLLWPAALPRDGELRRSQGSRRLQTLCDHEDVPGDGQRIDACDTDPTTRKHHPSGSGNRRHRDDLAALSHPDARITSRPGLRPRNHDRSQSHTRSTLTHQEPHPHSPKQFKYFRKVFLICCRGEGGATWRAQAMAPPAALRRSSGCSGTGRVRSRHSFRSSTTPRRKRSTKSSTRSARSRMPAGR